MYHDNTSTGFRAWPLGLCCQVIKGVQCIKNKNIKKADDRDRHRHRERQRHRERETETETESSSNNLYGTLQETIQTLLVLAYVFQSILISAAIAS